MSQILLKGKKSKQRVCKSFKLFPPYHSPYRNIGPSLRIFPCTSGTLNPLVIQRIFEHFISGILSMNNWPIYFHNYILLILIKCNLRPREGEPFTFFTNSSLVQCSVGAVILLQLMEKLHILFQLNGASSKVSLMKLGQNVYLYEITSSTTCSWSFQAAALLDMLQKHLSEDALSSDGSSQMPGWITF